MGGWGAFFAPPPPPPPPPPPGKVFLLCCGMTTYPIEEVEVLLKLSPVGHMESPASGALSSVVGDVNIRFFQVEIP